MKVYKCLIVDDEPPAIRLVKSYVEKVPFLSLSATTTKALEAIQIIDDKDIDLVFLDIQMPDLTGIQLSKIIYNKVKIIFTTAYPQFALESYDINALDYLLKPFEFERFYQATLKIKATEEKKTPPIQDNPQDFVFIKTDGKNNFEKVYIQDIQYIEGVKNYVAIHLPHKRIITYNTLKNIQEELPKNDFIKIHKSFIVSIRHITKTSTISVFVNDKELPLGNTHKVAFFERINERKM